MTITIEKSTSKKLTWTVKLMKKVVGEIVLDLEHSDYCYYPKGSKVGGEKFPSLTACIKSLGDE